MGLGQLICCSRTRKPKGPGGGESNRISRGHDPVDVDDDSPHMDIDGGPAPVTRKPTTGLRKPGDTAASEDCHPHGGFDLKETQPNDYLYFGPPGESHRNSGPHQITSTQGRHKSTGSQAELPTGNSPSPARDDSGFLNTGLNNQQMGYQHLTYGGSLQHDYTGTHNS
jgi:hypothetical protein